MKIRGFVTSNTKIGYKAYLLLLQICELYLDSRTFAPFLSDTEQKEFLFVFTLLGEKCFYA